MESSMSDDTAFAGFVRRIRAGDEQAARELVERYEPVIRREVKMRLRDPRLYRRLDWADICQSVLASFFVRAASGQYDLSQPDQLLRLLVVMTRHKLSKQERRHRADKRDYRLAEERDAADLEGRPGAEPAGGRPRAARGVSGAALGRGADAGRPPRQGLRMGGNRRQGRRDSPGPSHATGPCSPARRAAARGMRGRR
jgi:ECF sigma factor